jgi:hypothetical protein
VTSSPLTTHPAGSSSSLLVLPGLLLGISREYSGHPASHWAAENIPAIQPLIGQQQRIFLPPSVAFTPLTAHLAGSSLSCYLSQWRTFWDGVR